jgi:hypothetical protein
MGRTRPAARPPCVLKRPHHIFVNQSFKVIGAN